MTQFEQTLKQSVSISGTGLHTGLPARVTLHPAEAGSGILFFRVDQAPETPIKACVENVDALEGQGRQTALGTGKVKIRTIEHLMAVFHGLGVDNARVEVEGEELPGLDGSAVEYFEKIKEAGLVTQAKEREVFVVKEPIFVKGENYAMALLPHPGFAVSYTLSYDGETIPDQYVHFEISPEVFETQIVSSRTFCLKQEAEALLAQGYGRGANLKNTLVFDNGEPLENRLRFKDEAARHKVLDIVGDLYLLGKSIRGHLVTSRTGHRQNYELVKKMREFQTGSNKGKEGKGIMSQIGRELSVKDIQKILPHRYPFLLVDRVIDLEPGKKAVGIKNVTMNEHFFQGHFPNHPVMPGVLIIEAMAQLGGVVMLSMHDNHGKIAYFMSIDSAKFRQPVLPGDTLRLEVEVLRVRSRTGQCAGRAYVGDKLVCEAEVKFAVVDADESALKTEG